MGEEQHHQALYRRYRPQTPADVLGQDHIVRGLTGAIREDRLHHAFLFSGPRGTGKTSTARILAKMVNCERGPTAEPCGECSQCLAVREGTLLDVVEIDAASHGGVEDARELREKAPTAPVQGREKIYIIDEAQRLSREAFDALLKVFEEPPPGVRFVLATTEPHKMPPTIVGRCQRFDFRRLTMDDLATHLVKVAEGGGQRLEPGAAHAIARQARLGARRALAARSGGRARRGHDRRRRALLGAPRGEVQHELADAVAIGDARGVFELVARLVQDGQDLRNVTAESLAHFRNLLLVKTAPGQPDLVDVPDDAYDALRIQAEKYTPGELARVLSLLLAAQNDMRWTTSPRLSLELALVRATMPETDDDPTALLTRLERLERLANLDPGTVVPTAADVEQAVRRPKPHRRPRIGGPHRGAGTDDGRRDVRACLGPRPHGPPGAHGLRALGPEPHGHRAHDADAGAPRRRCGSVDVALLRRSWQPLLEHLSSNREMILAAILESATVAGYDGQTLELAFPPDRKVGPQKVEGLKKAELQWAALGDMFGIKPDIVCVVREVRDAGGRPPSRSWRRTKSSTRPRPCDACRRCWGRRWRASRSARSSPCTKARSRI